MGAAEPAAAAALGSRIGELSVALLLITNLMYCCSSQATTAETPALKLPREEVDVLRRIAGKLNISDKLWNFSVNPCSWNQSVTDPRFIESNLTCGDCDNATNLCHVTSIVLKGQNLTGVLPEEFGRLPYLVQIDLSRNYINGSIPAAWASLSKLLNISLLSNRLSGPIPEEIGKITTLQSLVLGDNRLDGPLPWSLGNLANLSRLFLSANFFTGMLPETLGNLRKLIDVRLDGNDFRGKIPDFIGNWTQLKRLGMKGTSLEGPFPPNFSLLQELIELRVSDLKKSDGIFPPIMKLEKIKFLVLRNCSISGQIPEYIGKMPSLQVLDLSFNELTGPIPINLGNLWETIEKMYLTNNKLNGSIPAWIQRSPKKLDVSYNTFTDTASAPSGCPPGDLNFVSSFSSTQDKSINSCLRKGLPCAGKAKNYQFFINCGGRKVIVNGKEYEDDSYSQGSSTYFLSTSGKWAFSSTGDFVGNSDLLYVAWNRSQLAPNSEPELYMSARSNPLSLRYYGLCLQKGEYTVKLHFAEIIFNDDQTFSSNGRRLFDVSIQDKIVLKDFNIATEANGTGKAVVKNFTAVVVDTTLEIHFQWAGKGTDSTPYKGAFGPLISAISVTPNFKPRLDNKKLSLSALLGSLAASCVLLMLILIFLLFILRRRLSKNIDFGGRQMPRGYNFSFKQIKAATGNFDPVKKIGEDKSGPIFKGVLPDGSLVAVKHHSSKPKQGSHLLVHEIGMMLALEHPNLVKLFGYCIEGDQLLLIYEYMENNSLALTLFGPEDTKLKLDWQTRHKICLGVARGLAYLHEESILKIVHRDIKATNILLDKDLNAKISDFSLEKLEENKTCNRIQQVGNKGYMAPEYAMDGYLTDKADVYSFGVITLEIVSGKSSTNYRPKDGLFDLVDQAFALQERGNLLELVDPRLNTNYSEDEALQLLNLALLCTNPFPTLRPLMCTVVSMLEGPSPVRTHPSTRHIQ